MVNNQYFSQVRSTSENTDIFTTRDEIYLVFTEKKVFFLFIILNGKHRKQSLTVSLVVFRSFFSACLLGIKLSVNLVCT